MLLIIIRNRKCITCNCYSNIDLLDLLVTVSYVEGYFVEVLVAVSEHIRSKSHHGLTSISSLRLGGSAKGDIRFFIKSITDISHFITCNNMLRSIIVNTAVITNNSDSDVDRSNLLITISYFKGYCLKVCICVFELRSCKTHISLTCICSFC